MSGEHMSRIHVPMFKKHPQTGGGGVTKYFAFLNVRVGWSDDHFLLKKSSDILISWQGLNNSFCFVNFTLSPFPSRIKITKDY